ncbi:MAG: S-layer homology domain-containing protein [Firmicutes bacterium]|nr:S-layer homology domain-containing protein [Bacillota bacterium]
MQRRLALFTMLLLLCCSIPALALDEPKIAIRILGTLEKEENELVLEWQIKANHQDLTLINTQGLCLAYDNTVLQLMQCSEPFLLIEDSELSDKFIGIAQAGKGVDYDFGVKVYAALNNSDNIGYILLSVGDSYETCYCAKGKYISIEQIRFAFRSGKNEADLYADSIRIMTAFELRATEQSHALLLYTTENEGTPYTYLTAIGEDNLEAPEIIYSNSDKLRPTTDTAATQNKITAVTTEAANKDTVSEKNDESYDIDKRATDLIKVPTAAPTLIFTDIPTQAWFFQAIKYVTDKGLMNGMTYEIFSPNLPLTKAMLATILYRLAESPETMANKVFTDVPAGQWYSQAISWANEKDLLTGNEGDVFGLNDSITREHVAVILSHYEELSGIDTTAKAILSKYKDAEIISVWAKEAMQWSVAEGIIVGRSPTSLAPEKEMTRAEIAQILARKY